MTSLRFLTGITTSGTPHLGNYVGSIRPSVQASLRADVESFYFLADYHALIKTDELARVQCSTLEIAASWLAAGSTGSRHLLPPIRYPRNPGTHLAADLCHRQRRTQPAHAYKASVDKNPAAGQDSDSDVTAGLFMYPVLMGADIFDVQRPQGTGWARPGAAHQMARDMGNSFNHRYGQHFVARSGDRRRRGAAAGRRWRQDEQELRQPHPDVCAARTTPEVDRRHRHRLARARCSQRDRRLGPVSDLPGVCQRG
ncbi:MAG: hypothetical protein IPO43_14320 [Rhodoferax sp.]|nr:hypothetical protein [Rhodoferax sp.]